MDQTMPTHTSRLKLSYCYGGTAMYEPGEVLGPRLLSDFEVVLIIEGFPHHETKEGLRALEPGSIMIAQPGSTETYRWDTKARTRHAYLHFDLETIPDDWPDPSGWPHHHANPPLILGQLFRHMAERAFRHNDWPAQQPGNTDNRVFETFLDLYLTMEDTASATTHRNLSEPVRRAARFMLERLDNPHFEPFALDELAAVAHVSSKHLCRMFSKELGFPPMKVCRLMQFQLAIPLLARSNLIIKEIAERCGFPDQLYFSRTFSEAFGKSPSQIRKDLLQGQPPPPIPLPPALMPRFYW